MGEGEGKWEDKEFMQATVIHVFATFLIQIEEYIRKNWNAANDQTRILIQNKVCG